MKPRYTHDCDKCIYLGTVYARRENDCKDYIDCYWCANRYPSLSSVLGRYGNEGPEYMSSHPPEAFASGNDYLMMADRWYLFAMFQAVKLGLYNVG